MQSPHISDDQSMTKSTEAKLVGESHAVIHIFMGRKSWEAPDTKKHREINRPHRGQLPNDADLPTIVLWATIRALTPPQ